MSGRGVFMAVLVAFAAGVGETGRGIGVHQLSHESLRRAAPRQRPQTANPVQIMVEIKLGNFVSEPGFAILS